MNCKRFFSSALAITIISAAIFYNIAFIVIICALTVGALYEFFYLIKKKDIPIYSYTGIFIGLAIPISTYRQFTFTRNWELLLFVVGFLLMLLLQFNRKDNKNAIIGLSTTMFGVIYVSWFFSFLIKIRFMLPGVDGVKLLAFILLVTKSGDIGALLVGSWIGKHPLLPSVSPNKSVEGAIGSLIFSSLVAVLCHPLLPEVGFTHVHVALMGAFFGSLGQLGDLSESLIKRDCQVKDSGTFLPGMGGVLDVIDSLLFSAPAFYLYMSATLGL